MSVSTRVMSPLLLTVFRNGLLGIVENKTKLYVNDNKFLLSSDNLIKTS